MGAAPPNNMLQNMPNRMGAAPPNNMLQNMPFNPSGATPPGLGFTPNAPMPGLGGGLMQNMPNPAQPRGLGQNGQVPDRMRRQLAALALSGDSINTPLLRMAMGTDKDTQIGKSQRIVQLAKKMSANEATPEEKAEWELYKTDASYKFTISDRLMQLSKKMAKRTATREEEEEYDYLRSAQPGAIVTSPLYRDIRRDIEDRESGGAPGAGGKYSAAEEAWIESALKTNKTMTRDQIIREGKRIGRIRR